VFVQILLTHSMTVALWPWPWPWKPFSNGHSYNDYLLYWNHSSKYRDITSCGTDVNREQMVGQKSR